jgi:hypothetical protein
VRFPVIFPNYGWGFFFVSTSSRIRASASSLASASERAYRRGDALEKRRAHQRLDIALVIPVPRLTVTILENRVTDQSCKSSHALASGLGSALTDPHPTRAKTT